MGKTPTASSATEPNNASGITLPVSLRDWFAGQALAGNGFDAYDLDGDDYPNLAARCYMLADAMLVARLKPAPESPQETQPRE